jgi:hypothetical protein
MDMPADAPFTIKLIRLPAWAGPIVVIVVAVFFVVAAFVSLSLLLALIPILVSIVIAQRMFGHRKDTVGVYSHWTGLRSRDRAKSVIDADNEVLDALQMPKA